MNVEITKHVLTGLKGHSTLYKMKLSSGTINVENFVRSALSVERVSLVPKTSLSLNRHHRGWVVFVCFLVFAVDGN